MATIVGGIATSHTPTIGFALDANKHNDPVWAPIFAGYLPVQEWLAKKKPDVLFVIYNDHITSFFFDHYSQFALGVGDRYWPADEGGGPRKLPAIDGHPDLARHIATGLVADEFDLGYFQAKGLDHGCFSPLSLLWPRVGDRWPGAIVPLQVGVLQFPIPSASVASSLATRCARRSKATPLISRSRSSAPADCRTRFTENGRIQQHAWVEFLELLEKDPEKLTEISIAEYARLGGCEGSEVIMWLVMRGALNTRVKKLHQAYYLPSMTPICTVIFENESDEGTGEAVDAYRKRIGHEWAGMDQIPGTYPFTLDRSVKAYRLNHFLHELIQPKVRARFLAEPEVLFEEAGLTAEERDMLRTRDWRALIHYGVIFFLLEKLGAVIGTTNLHIYAAMRGQSLEDFQKTRNSQILYSVAGDMTPAKPA